MHPVKLQIPFHNCLPLWGALLFAGLIGSFSDSALLAQQEDDSQLRQVDQINKYIRQTWDDYELKPSVEATENEWCRRVYLDIIGRIPTVEELKEFSADKSKDKKQKLVETLLYDDVYTEEFVRNWTTLWTNLLIGRTGGMDDNSMVNRAGMQKFLRDSFARNKPYDKMAYELVTATGKTAPGENEFNGAVNFLIDKVNEENASLATAATSRIFLGLQVQCTQCHNHPFNDWKQQKYWEMNAFFRQVRAFPGGMRGSNAAAELADQDFNGESGNIDEADLFFELRNGLIKVAYPVFVDGSEIDRSGYVNVVNRRKVLADKIVESPYFSKAAVNRVWAHFLGYGFTNPVDDLGPHNIPTHPELLDYLSQEFRSSSFDVRKLISWIALSEPYSLSSRRTKTNQSDDPLLGEPPKFSHFYLRQMRAEELYESLMVATQAAESRGNYEQQETLKSNWLRQFSQAFGTDEGDETTTFNGTIPQVLMMFNGDLIKRATSAKGGLIDGLVKNTKMDDKDRVDYLFMAGLGRKPNREEANLAKQLYQARSGDMREALTDLWWVVLNSNEFIFNH
ncbi:MAG: DUF1549 and DUF1553 domain-containing protein [Mariniblastus sp.]|nr:DUF1549 and DUF1553 domain-containing protein [Mariniblastus sp.]